MLEAGDSQAVWDLQAAEDSQAVLGLREAVEKALLGMWAAWGTLVAVLLVLQEVGAA